MGLFDDIRLFTTKASQTINSLASSGSEVYQNAKEAYNSIVSNFKKPSKNSTASNPIQFGTGDQVGIPIYTQSPSVSGSVSGGSGLMSLGVLLAGGAVLFLILRSSK